MNLSYKYKIYPASNQESTLISWLEACTLLYNKHLELEITSYKKDKKFLSAYELNYNIPLLSLEYPILYDVYGQVLREINGRLDKAFRNFFRRVKKKENPGFPRFKTHTISSFTFPQLYNGNVRLEGKDRIRIPKIGLIKINYHRDIEGKVKQVHIKRNLLGEWFVIFVCEVEKELLPKTSKSIGIDLGINHIVHYSNNRYKKLPDDFKDYEKRIVKTQKKLSDNLTNIKKSSKKPKRLLKLQKEREKLLRVKRKQQKKLNNKKDYFIHCLSKRIVNKYDTIVMEDLNIKQMMDRKLYDGKKSLRRNIAKSSWNQLQQYISYKAEKAGRKLILVNPHNTSRLCSNCGCINNLLLKDRIYKCKECGFSTKRDHNAAINIKKIGMEMHSLNLGSKSRKVNL